MDVILGATPPNSKKGVLLIAQLFPLPYLLPGCSLDELATASDS